MVLDQTHSIFQDIVETIREPLLVLDSDLKIIMANRSFINLFKVTQEETLGNFIYNLGNKQWDIPKLRELLEIILPQHIVFDNYEIEHFFPTIGNRIMLLNARQIHRAFGKERIILLAIEDVTERIQLETMLKDSEERYRRLFETAKDGILLLDKKEWKIRHANPAITLMLGYSNAEYIGNKMEDVGFTFDKGMFQELLQRLDNEGVVYFKDFPVRTKGNQSVDTDIYMVDKAHLLQCNIRDITDQKRADEEKSKFEAQLQHTEKMDSIGSLAGGIAHDLNNILFPISGLSEMLLDEIPPNDPMHESIEQIHKSAKRGSDLVKQILAFSRQSNHQKLPIRIQPILKEVLNLIRSTISTNIEITSDIESDCGLVSADPTQMHQIAMNLITNAYHAVEQTGGTIHVKLKEAVFEKGDLNFHEMQSGGYARITISDTGTGIDQALINKIFEPYFTTKEQGKGTGLGLSVVHGIVKEHGGDIQVYSEFGKGTIFYVYTANWCKLRILETYFIA